MEFEYQDPSRRRGKMIIVAGVIVALVAGGLAFYVLYQARQDAQSSGTVVVPVVVAAVPIAPRVPIVETDVVLRQVPADATTGEGTFADPAAVVGLMATVPILAGQPVYANMLASGTSGTGLAILDPGETIGPDSEAWRAVSLTVPDDRAAGGLIQAGDIVDVFVTASITVPLDLAAKGKYTSDKSTKITYQNVKILQRATSYYVVRVSLPVAEEISHLQAAGSGAFSLALRPTEDARTARRHHPRRDDDRDDQALRPADPRGLPGLRADHGGPVAVTLAVGVAGRLALVGRALADARHRRSGRDARPVTRGGREGGRHHRSRRTRVTARVEHPRRDRCRSARRDPPAPRSAGPRRPRPCPAPAPAPAGPPDRR